MATTGVLALPQCKAQGCFLRDTEANLERHMQDHHDYCRKCKEFFNDWEALALHRIHSDQHIACPFCGNEYKSIAGVTRHVELEHPPNQHMPCIGCGLVFDRASHAIGHWEDDKCKVITAQEFAARVQHKVILSNALRDNPSHPSLGTGYYGADHDNDEAGGVRLQLGGGSTLLESQNASDTTDLAYATLEPGKSDNTSDRLRTPLEEYPVLQSTDKMGQPKLSMQNLAGHLASLSSGGVLIESIGTEPTAASTVNASKATDIPWSNKVGASKKLFPEATNKTDDSYPELFERQNKEISKAHGPNLFAERVWDPFSADFSPELYYHPISEHYNCPFECDKKFMTPNDLRKHIATAHRIKAMRCPYHACHRFFNSHRALIAHCEAPGSKCKIKYTDGYAEIIHLMTGGFVSVDTIGYPDVPVKDVVITKKDPLNKKNKVVTVQTIRHEIHKYSSEKPEGLDKMLSNADGGHISVAAHFAGGRLPPHRIPLSPEDDLRNDLVGSSHEGHGLQTDKVGHEVYSLRKVDLAQQRKRDLWKHAAQQNHPEKYRESLTNGSIRLADFDDDSDTASELNDNRE